MSANFSDQLGKRLVAFREAKGLRQADVAETLGVTLAGYGHYERGFRRVPVHLLSKLAQILECTETELLGVSEPKAKRGPPSDWEKRISTIKDLPRERQREIQNVVDALIAQAG